VLVIEEKGFVVSCKSLFKFCCVTHFNI